MEQRSNWAMEVIASGRYILLFSDLVPYSAAMRPLIRSFPNRSPSGLPVYVAAPHTAPFARGSSSGSR